MLKRISSMSLILGLMMHPSSGADLSLVEQIKMLPKFPVKSSLKNPRAVEISLLPKPKVRFRKFVETVRIYKLKTVNQEEPIKYHYNVRLIPVAKAEEIMSANPELQLQGYQDILDKYPQSIKNIYLYNQEIIASRAIALQLKEQLDLLDKIVSDDDNAIDDIFLDKWANIANEIMSFNNTILMLEYKRNYLFVHLDISHRELERDLREIDVFTHQQQLLKEQIRVVTAGA